MNQLPPGYPPTPSSGNPAQGSSYAQGQYARRERKGEFTGVGCLVQGLGLLLVLGAGVGGFLAFSIPGAIIGGLVGGVGGLALLLIGGRMALKWVCSACRNPLADGSVRMCPTCRAHLM